MVVAVLAEHITGRKRYSLRTAINSPIQRFRRHEKQMPINRNIPLTARTEQRGAQFDLFGIVDVIGIDAVVIAHKKMVAAEGQIGIDGAVHGHGRHVGLGVAVFAVTGSAAPAVVRLDRWSRSCSSHVARREARRFWQRCEPLQAEGGFAGVVQSRLQTNAWIVVAARGFM